jgi:hypothetical protein
MVIPNQLNDMHNGKDPERIERGDHWLRTNLEAYVQWADTHNSLLIVTWDEDNGKSDNHIPTILVGPMVRQGRFGEQVDHYGLLRTVEDMYGAKPVGVQSASQPPHHHLGRTCPRALARFSDRFPHSPPRLPQFHHHERQNAESQHQLPFVGSKRNDFENLLPPGAQQNPCL